MARFTRCHLTCKFLDALDVSSVHLAVMVAPVTGRWCRRMARGGSGGPKEPRNGNYKNGRYTAETTATRQWLRQHIREVTALTKGLREL
jgi:hypothetical protein